jgi:molecular chaperone GrpE
MTRKEKLESKATEAKKTKKHGKEAVHTARKPAHDTEMEKLKESLRASEDKLREFHDKYLRLSAEFDNYRKRTLKERAELIKTAGDDLLRQILPVVDNFERGLKAMEHSSDLEALREGVTLIYNRFKEFLSQQGIKEISAMNEPFNIDFHEAVTTIPAPDENMKGKILDVIEKGYILHDKVVRYAKVVVGE